MGINGHFSFISDFNGTALIFSSFRMMLTVCFSYVAFIMFEYVPYIPTCSMTFIMKPCWILSNLFSFSSSIEVIMWYFYFLFIYMLYYIYFLHMLNLYFWNKANLIMGHAPFDTCLYSISKDFRIYVYQEYWHTHTHTHTHEWACVHTWFGY